MMEGNTIDMLVIYEFLHLLNKRNPGRYGWNMVKTFIVRWLGNFLFFFNSYRCILCKK